MVKIEWKQYNVYLGVKAFIKNYRSLHYVVSKEIGGQEA